MLNFPMSSFLLKPLLQINKCMFVCVKPLKEIGASRMNFRSSGWSVTVLLCRHCRLFRTMVHPRQGKKDAVTFLSSGLVRHLSCLVRKMSVRRAELFISRLKKSVCCNTHLSQLLLRKSGLLGEQTFMIQRCPAFCCARQEFSMVFGIAQGRKRSVRIPAHLLSGISLILSDSC